MTSIGQDNFELKLLAPGANWTKIGGMIALGLTGYYGPIGNGSTVSVHAMHPGEACMNGPVMVDEGRYHIALNSPSWFLKTAAAGQGPGFAERPLRLRALGVLPHFDQFAFAVRKDTGITSIADIKEHRYPLRASAAPIHLGHPAGWVLDILLEEYGMSITDIEEWGGSVIHGDRQPNLMEKVPDGRMDRVSAMQAGALDAVLDEAMMTLPWKNIADTVDLNFLPIDEDVLERLQKKYGVGRAVLPAGSLRGIDRDIPTIDFSGWVIYCREDLPDDLAFFTLQAIEQQKTQIESLFRSHQGLTGEIDLSKMCHNTGLPLHSGAEKFYRERGYL